MADILLTISGGIICEISDFVRWIHILSDYENKYSETVILSLKGLNFDCVALEFLYNLFTDLALSTLLNCK